MFKIILYITSVIISYGLIIPLKEKHGDKGKFMCILSLFGPLFILCYLMCLFSKEVKFQGFKFKRKYKNNKLRD